MQLAPFNRIDGYYGALPREARGDPLCIGGAVCRRLCSACARLQKQKSARSHKFAEGLPVSCVKHFHFTLYRDDW